MLDGVQTDELMIDNLLVPHSCCNETQDFDYTRASIDSGLKNLLEEVEKEKRKSGTHLYPVR